MSDKPTLLLRLIPLTTRSGFIRRSGAVPDVDEQLLPWRTRSDPRSVSALNRPNRRTRPLTASIPSMYTCRSVYDVSSRATFEELTRWSVWSCSDLVPTGALDLTLPSLSFVLRRMHELETYTAPDVVKIVVGNKVDKVRMPNGDSAVYSLLTASNLWLWLNRSSRVK